ncbi:MAG: LytTR family transcriptional regulator [Clostridia bacterium]|nr:LytTR family transcriptional regulator [Clostridia bacterium]
MKVEFRRDSAAAEPYVLVCAKERNQAVDALMQSIAQAPVIAAYSERGEELLMQREIKRIYTLQRRVLADTDRGTFALRERMYELEEKLDQTEFVRISNSEIVNKRRIRRLDFSLAGTIRLVFRDGAETYVSRRYVPRIRSIFEGGGKGC